jgi:hypothetical protein
MKPITFPEVNKTYAKDQPEYTPLPGHYVDDPKGQFIFCMRLSLMERLRLLFTGRIWCSLLTFGGPLTPSFFSTKKSDLFTIEFTWLFYLNYYLLQFFFVRLTLHTAFDLRWWSIQYWIKPLTGWKDDFKYVGKSYPRFLVISRKYKYEP